MELIPTLFLDWAYGTFRPALRKDLERSARNDIEGPVFPYPHLKANLISSESRLHVVGASKNEVVEHECEILRRVLCSREPRAFCASRSRGREDTAVLVQPSSRRQERYEYSVVAVKSLRCQQCDCLRGDHDCSAHAAPAERSM